MQEAKHFVVDIISINGEEFVVKDENGKEANIHVGTETEKFGHLQVGDRVDAWVYPNGQARTAKGRSPSGGAHGRSRNKMTQRG
jgi:hypothetical protein